MTRPDLADRVRRSGLERYLLTDEVPVIAQRQHWAKLAEPTSSAVAGLGLVLAVDSSMPADAGGIVNVLWWAWLFLVLRGALKWLVWWKNWFVATDKRMLVNYGLINVNVAMLSLTKVVDFSYTRTTMGYLLGYGTFVRESSGQSQSLHKVEWVRRPDDTYRTISAAIFGLDDQPRMTDVGDQRSKAGSSVHTASSYAEFVPFDDTASPQHRAITSDYSSRIRTRPASPQQDESDSWHPDPTAEPDNHDADTGPIPTDD
jgi:hypothetical protein